MGKRRGRRTRSDDGGGRRNIEEGFPQFRHNQWTFEGEIERLGHFTKAVNRRKRDPAARPLAQSRSGRAAFGVLGLLLLLSAAVFVVGVVASLLLR